jgi:predicted PurR-regulated permease PerM
MKDYGVFANLVAVAGSLASAAAAIILAFKKRSKWQPPKEVVPEGTARFAALFAMIVIALLYVFGSRIGQIALAIVTVIFFASALVSLMIAIVINTGYSFYYPLPESENTRTLGGLSLTEEAKQIVRKNGLTQQQLFEDAQGKKDQVWTRLSQAAVNVLSALTFIFLIGFGTSSLSAAAMLVVVYMATTH